MGISSEETVKSLNFDEILKKDLEKITEENYENGQIFNLIKFKHAEKHIFTVNKALFYFTFHKNLEENQSVDLWSIYDVKIQGFLIIILFVFFFFFFSRCF